MDVRIRRNAYGRQIDSFETTVPWAGIEGDPVKGVFIRAPRFADLGEGVEVLSTSEDGEPLAVREGRALAAAFHPELTDDSRVHAFFLERVVGSRGASPALPGRFPIAGARSTSSATMKTKEGGRRSERSVNL